jgi:hypothetical protein
MCQIAINFLNRLLRLTLPLRTLCDPPEHSVSRANHSVIPGGVAIVASHGIDDPRNRSGGVSSLTRDSSFWLARHTFDRAVRSDQITN